MRTLPRRVYAAFRRADPVPLSAMMVGLLVRVWAFGSIPPGLNQDEASTAYDAFCLIHYGMDRSGFHLPVMLVSWGSARYPEAERVYLEAISLRPEYATAMDNLSLVYAKESRVDLAVSYAERALPLRPDDPGISRHLASYRRRESGVGDPAGAK